MEKIIFKQTPLYRFLEYCNNEKTEEKPKILDCGAGGVIPPLSLFYNFGYETTGVELDEKQIIKANIFAKESKQKLNIKMGDMTKLDFNDNTFDFVYSYNSVFHMKKVQIEKAIKEMKRVFKT